MDCPKPMVLGLMVLLGCPADEEGETVTDAGGAGSAASTGADSSGDSGSTEAETGDDVVACPEGSLVDVDVDVESEVITADRAGSPESGRSSYDLSCTVESLSNDAGTTSVALTCLGAPDQADTAWLVVLDGVPADGLAVAEGEDVRMLLSVSWGFEVGGATLLRIEQEGAPVLLAHSETLEGGLVGTCGPGEEASEGAAETFFAPLALSIERGTCDPIERLRLDFDVDGEAASIYGGQEAAIGSSGWTVAAGAATCVSQEDDPEINGSDSWHFRVAAWKAGE